MTQLRYSTLSHNVPFTLPQLPSLSFPPSLVLPSTFLISPDLSRPPQPPYPLLVATISVIHAGYSTNLAGSDPRAAAQRRDPTSLDFNIISISNFRTVDGELQVKGTSRNGPESWHQMFVPPFALLLPSEADPFFSSRIEPDLQSLLYGRFFSKPTLAEVDRLLFVLSTAQHTPPAVAMRLYYLKSTSTNLNSAGSDAFIRMQRKWDEAVDRFFAGHLRSVHSDTGYVPIRRSPRFSSPSPHNNTSGRGLCGRCGDSCSVVRPFPLSLSSLSKS